SEVLEHLVPKSPRSEEAAFLFCVPLERDHAVRFNFRDWYRPVESEFTYKSIFGLELSDECRAKVIKRAHELNASIVEFHSHPLSKRPQFSPSDRTGFSEFVPHVRWRLKQRPYAAVVVGLSAFDSLFWRGSSDRPDGVLELDVGSKLLRPTGDTYLHWDE